MFSVCGVFRNFFSEGAPIFDILSSVFLKHIGNKKGSVGVRGHAPPKIFKKFTYCSGHFSPFWTFFWQILFQFFVPKSECFTKYDAVCTFSIMRALGVRLIAVEKVQNYGKFVFIKNMFKNCWWGGCIPHIPPRSAPACTDNNVSYHYTNQPIWLQYDVGQILWKLFWNNSFVLHLHSLDTSL